jgi:hypothetical protein
MQMLAHALKTREQVLQIDGKSKNLFRLAAAARMLYFC